MSMAAERGRKETPKIPEDLAKFVLINRERLVAVKASIRAIEKVGMAKEVHEQKLAEAQDLAEAVLDAEAKIGELTLKMEKANNGGANQFQAKRTAVSEKQTKAVALEKAGITEKQKQRYESVAKHPEAMQKAKEKARREGRVVTRRDVTDEVVNSMPRKPGVKEFIRQTEKEHEEFLESKKQGVVSIDAARADRRREEVIANQTGIKILNATQAVGKLTFINAFDLDLIVKVEGKDEAKDLIDSLIIAEKTLAMVRKRLEEKC